MIMLYIITIGRFVPDHNLIIYFSYKVLQAFDMLHSVIDFVAFDLHMKYS